MTDKTEENRYRMLFDIASDAIFVHDENGEFINVNKEACRSLGYSREELLKLNIIDFEIGPSLEELKEIWKKMDKAPLTLSGKHRRKDGTVFPVEVKLQAFIDKNKKQFIALARDITNQKKAEEQKEFIEAIYHAADNISFIMTNFDEQSLKITDFSPGAEKMFGYKKEEIIDKPVKILRPIEYQGEGKSVLISLEKGEKYYRNY